MTPEIIQAIGQYIVMPISLSTFAVYFVYKIVEVMKMP